MEKALIRMLQALSRAALGTGFPFLMTTLGAAVVFFFAEAPRPQFQKAMLGFAAGVMTAASVWSLLLPAIDRAADVGLPGWLPAAVGLLCGVVFLAALDAALPRLRRGRDEDPSRRQSTLLMAAITLHNVPEGMAVGLAFALAEAGEGHGRCRRTGHGNWNPEFPGGRGYLSAAAAGGVFPAAVFCVGNALRRGGARGGNLGSAGGGRSAAGDAVAFELCRRSHAVRSGGGAGAPSPFPDRDLRLCGRLFDHDDTGCGAGIGRLVKKETYVAS